MKVEIYSDVVCPWCYIGERRFARALAAFPRAGEVEVVFRPFQLDPGASTTAVPTARHLASRYGARAEGMMQNVTQVGAQEGIAFRFDRALAVNTRTAHRLLRLAEREHGPAVQRALAERLFDAHFTEGVDIGDRARLVELAAAAGMDAERVRGYLASGEGDAELGAELDEARALGVQAVPTFVFDGQYVVEGGQPASVFLQVLEEVERLGKEAAVATPGGEACADGACEV